MSKNAISFFPKELQEAPVEIQLQYIAKKKRESLLLYRLCIATTALFIALKIMALVDPSTSVSNTLIAEIVVIASPLLIGIGLRKMIRRYSEIESSLKQVHT